MVDKNNVLTFVEPEEALQNPISTEVTREKPFNKCFKCEYLRNGCSGPNLAVMTVDRACEFLQVCRQQLGYSYQKVADLSMLSVITVKRILSGQIKDPGFLTMQALSFVLVSDPNGKHPCAMHLVNEETKNAIIACKEAQDALLRRDQEFEQRRVSDREKIEFLKSQIDVKDSQLLEKDHLLHERYDFLKRKDRIIRLLGFLLALCLMVIIGALVVDGLNPDIGFFWVR